MSPAAKSLFVFGIYAVVAGTGLLGSLVVASVMPTPLLLFAAIDLAAAVWTAIALRQAQSPFDESRLGHIPGSDLADEVT